MLKQGIVATVIDIAFRLRNSRLPAADFDTKPGPGVYAFYIKNAASILPFMPGTDGLIYIGNATDLAKRGKRNHLRTGASGRSTLRKTLGAILKSSLSLTAVPRGSGASDQDFTNYKFSDEGEVRLTEWMNDNLEIGCYHVDDPKTVEDALIAELKPVLNLIEWKNPRAREIKLMRKLCSDEARRNAEAK